MPVSGRQGGRLLSPLVIVRWWQRPKSCSLFGFSLGDYIFQSYLDKRPPFLGFAIHFIGGSFCPLPAIIVFLWSPVGTHIACHGNPRRDAKGYRGVPSKFPWDPTAPRDIPYAIERSPARHCIISVMRGAECVISAVFCWSTPVIAH